MGETVKPQIGDVVTCRAREEAYYSNYGGLPECWFEPGDTGIIAAVDVPYVYHIKGKSMAFCCVDFTKDGRKWRVGMDPKNIRVITRMATHVL